MFKFISKLFLRLSVKSTKDHLYVDDQSDQLNYHHDLTSSFISDQYNIHSIDFSVTPPKILLALSIILVAGITTNVIIVPYVYRKITPFIRETFLKTDKVDASTDTCDLDNVNKDNANKVNASTSTWDLPNNETNLEREIVQQSGIIKFQQNSIAKKKIKLAMNEEDLDNKNKELEQLKKLLDEIKEATDSGGYKKIADKLAVSLKEKTAIINKKDELILELETELAKKQNLDVEYMRLISAALSIQNNSFNVFKNKFITIINLDKRLTPLERSNLMDNVNDIAASHLCLRHALIQSGKIDPNAPMSETMSETYKSEVVKNAIILAKKENKEFFFTTMLLDTLKNLDAEDI